ncbi:MAG: putative Ig domain-containing protein, partial [Phycisphaerae bacterium]
MRLSSYRPLFYLLLAVVCATSLVTSTGAQEKKLLAGRNVNMVSGTKLPFGDPYLQRQNEPSIAVSSRNPLHLLAGANDYRTVDFPDAPPTGDLPEGKLKGDAWLGIFKSFDGGQTWLTTLLPGFSQDQTEQGMLSPLKGFQAGSDPVVRAGTNGMFYYSGIVFDREVRGKGAVFVARFIDNNNKEGVRFDNPTLNPDPIKYIDATLVDTGNAGQFIDKPWLAVDVPRAGAASCTIPALEDRIPAIDGGGNQIAEEITIPPQTFPAGNVYLAYAIFVGNDKIIRTKLMFTRSTNCGADWSHPIKLSEGYPINQGTTVAVDPLNGDVYVAWRRFPTVNQSSAFMIAKSTDMGQTFTKAIEVATFAPFDLFEQGTSVVTFRTNAFPTMTVDNEHRVYLAWSQRKQGPGGDTSVGDARIMVKTSADGLNWTAAAQPADNHPDRGHQLMPSLSFAAGKVLLLYYDLRFDHTSGEFSRSLDPELEGKFVEFREPKGDLAPPGGEEGVFTDCVVERLAAGSCTLASPPNELQRRHTLDVRAAQATPADAPSFTPTGGETTRVSRYLHVFDSSTDKIFQFQFNPPNLPLFDGGTKPFMGDYVDLAAAPTFLPDPETPGKWIHNTGGGTGALTASSTSSAPTISPVFHATWTDNRDVRISAPPGDSTAVNYNPPNSDQPGFSTGAVCNDDTITKTRDQNIYTARLTEGLIAGSFGNTKPIDVIQRAFAVFVKNTTREEKFYRLTIVQPPSGVTASFDQFVARDKIEVTVQPLSTVTRAVFVEGDVKLATINVQVEEIDAPLPEPDGIVLPDGLQSLVLLNPDILSPDILSPDILSPDILSPDILSFEVYNPDILSPDILSPDILSPDILSPDILSPDILSPDILSPDILSPDILSPDILSPDILSPDILSPDILSPDILSPDILSPDILSAGPDAQLTSITWKVRNAGNTNAAYAFSPISASRLPEDIKFVQLLVFRITTTPIAQGCVLKRIAHIELISNILNPDILSPDILSPDILSPDILSANTATFSVAPGPDEEILVTLLVLDTNDGPEPPGPPFVPGTVAGVVASQAVNTQDLPAPGEVPPPPPIAISLLITTTSLPDGVVDTPYSQVVETIGGTEPFSWSVVEGVSALPDAGLDLDPATGVIFGSPSATGTFDFTVEVADSSSPQQVATRALSILIRTDALTITTASLPDGTVGVSYNETLSATGGTGSFNWSLAASSNPLPNGLALSSGGVISGPPTTAGTFLFTVQVTDDLSDTATADLTIVIDLPPPLVITTTSLPDGVLNALYSETLLAGGGTGPLTWSLFSGTLPPGLALSSSGVISGIINATGSFTFTVKVNDSSSPTQQTDTQTLTILVPAPAAAFLVFVTQPSNTTADQAITPPVSAQLFDSTMAVIPGVSITMTIGTNPCPGTLSGGTVVPTNVAGIASFPGLSIDKGSPG